MFEYVSFRNPPPAELTEVQERAQELQKLDRTRKLAALMSTLFFAPLALHLIFSPNMDLFTLLTGVGGGAMLGSSLMTWKMRSNLKNHWEIVEEDPSMKWRLQDMRHDLQQLKSNADQKIQRMWTWLNR